MENLTDESKTEGSAAKSRFTVILAIIIAVLLVTNLVTLIIVFSKMSKKAMEAPDSTSVQEEIDLDTDQSAVNNQPTATEDLDEKIEPSSEQTEIVDPREGSGKVLPANQVSVDWKPYPSEEPFGTLLPWDYFDSKKAKNMNITEESVKIYHVGSINAGAYQGGDFYTMTIIDYGMSAVNHFHRIIKLGDRKILLNQYSDQYFADSIKGLFEVNNTLEVINLEPPKSISIPDSKYQLVKIERQPSLFINEYGNLEKRFKYRGDDYVYFDNQKECFVASAGDGTAREYFIDIGFIKNSKVQVTDGPGNAMSEILNITWSDGSKNTAEYFTVNVGGCGFFGCYDFNQYINQHQDSLVKIGKTEKDGAIYAYDASKINSIDQLAADNPLRAVYLAFYQPEDAKKISFEEYLADRPLIYWKDPFGNFMQFRNAKYIPAVECGKPVIYLYPEQTMDINVKVEPIGGLSVSIPEYHQGWRVKAEPNSRIFNYGDQQTYPYLFWEGFSYNYQQPKTGFVIAAAEVPAFLDYTLAKLGLVKNEIDDFKEFWVPKMQAKPYYFITFLPQPIFDQMAPLTVSPQPKNVIRVFMDYQGLDEYRPAAAPKIITPARDGYTVVEWGGALHD